MSRMPAVGEIVDDVFRVESELDSGNFGAVYKVHDTLEDRILALKVLKPGPHDEQELRQRFEREARLVYSLRHPHVIQVFYYGQTDSGLPYMAMEYLEGTDLRDLLHHHGALSPALLRRISYETLVALQAAHELGIVHRDLKPANIYLVNDGAKGHVKVLDFGFAKALEDDNQGEITNAGTLVGTPAYMSPELVHKKNVGPPADLYAMGLIMAEMVTGEKLVQIENVYDTILFQASPKPIKLPREIQDSPFGAIIARAIAKDLDERYRTAAEMIADLKALDVGGELEEIVVDAFHGAAPPAREFGQEDPNARTRPRSSGLPSMAEVDAALHGDAAPALLDDEPTINRSGVEAPVPPELEMALELPSTDTPWHTAELSAAPENGTAEPADESFIIGDFDIPSSLPQAERSVLGEVILGIIVGVIFVALILGVLVLM